MQLVPVAPDTAPASGLAQPGRAEASPAIGFAETLASALAARAQDSGPLAGSDTATPAPPMDDSEPHASTSAPLSGQSVAGELLIETRFAFVLQPMAVPAPSTATGATRAESGVSEPDRSAPLMVTRESSPSSAIALEGCHTVDSERPTVSSLGRLIARLTADDRTRFAARLAINGETIALSFDQPPVHDARRPDAGSVAPTIASPARDVGAARRESDPQWSLESLVSRPNQTSDALARPRLGAPFAEVAVDAPRPALDSAESASATGAIATERPALMTRRPSLAAA
ncbi:MAG: hypothetical protein NZ518_08530, partial [Dehalococcoidia bacterium]|nr:hypothetical protein [Dehalococcoidia bacterium]